MVKKWIDQSKMSHLLCSLGRFHQIDTIMTQLRHDVHIFDSISFKFILYNGDNLKPDHDSHGEGTE
ncbi:hypothetical protein [Paenibacillus polymyxa]|uniref:hypothetical protein n=1 Tax=Paenibacillus polymyxa TaxID=1406 RepID=UPI0032AEB530